jgi:hypothetical protein
VNAFFALALAALLAAAPTPTPSPSPSPSPSTSAAASAAASPAGVAYVVGQLLALQDGYVVFTTGDAVRVLPGAPLPARPRMGAFVRARLDPASHAVAALAYANGRTAGDLDAEHLPREYVVASPKSLRSAPPPGGQGSNGDATAATITIDLRVPDSTPLGDDVYLATDRSNFSAAEVRMLRVEAQRFSVSLRLPVGTQLRYEFTRGSFTSIERDKLGGIVEPRTLDVKADATVRDSVARWADVN